MDSLSGFNVFIQVAKTRSFVAAGRLLGVSASAVGKSVARLEAKLSVRLFHRSTRSITLTAEGMLFLERSQRILAEIEATEQDLLQATTTPRGRLRVSLPLVSSLVLPILGDFMREYPEIELDLDLTDRLVDVIEEGFDVVVRIGEPADSRLSARQLGSFQILLVASPEYLERCGTPENPTDLVNHACLHYRYPSTGKLEVWPLHSVADSPELQLPPSIICNNMEARMSFALQGLGITCLPDFAIRDALTEGRLRTVLGRFVERTSPFHVLWPSGRQASTKVRVFIDFLSMRVFPVAKNKGAIRK